jgi:hypothetical protein
MLFHLILGAAAAVIFVLLFQKFGKDLSVGSWILTVLALLYSVFVLEVIYGFAIEGVPRAALVMGLITGIIAVVWWVLLGRFAFAKKAS